MYSAFGGRGAERWAERRGAFPEHPVELLNILGKVQTFPWLFSLLSSPRCRTFDKLQSTTEIKNRSSVCLWRSNSHYMLLPLGSWCTTRGNKHLLQASTESLLVGCPQRRVHQYFWAKSLKSVRFSHPALSLPM